MKLANVKLLGLKLNLEEWNPVFDAHCVDEKVRLLTVILTRDLDDTLPKRSVRMHPTDKLWITPHIKKELKLDSVPIQSEISAIIRNCVIKCHC